MCALVQLVRAGEDAAGAALSLSLLVDECGEMEAVYGLPAPTTAASVASAGSSMTSGGVGDASAVAVAVAVGDAGAGGGGPPP
jgi:hypothetical protein